MKMPLRRALLPGAIGQREGAGWERVLPHRLRLLRVLDTLPLIGAAQVLVSEVHPRQPVVLEYQARGAGPALVLLLVALLLVAAEGEARLVLFLRAGRTG